MYQEGERIHGFCTNRYKNGDYRGCGGRKKKNSSQLVSGTAANQHLYITNENGHEKERAGARSPAIV